MPTSFTKETEPTTSFTKELKPGQVVTTLTWDDATQSWDNIGGTWDSPVPLAATTYTKETKP